MDRRADVPTALAQSDLSPARITFYARAEAGVVEEIGCGVLFVMAFWSAASRQSWARLAEVLGRLDPTGRLEVVVVDTDGLPDVPLEQPFLGERHGYGETAWVRNGRIVSTGDYRSSRRHVEASTLLLLGACGAAEG